MAVGTLSSILWTSTLEVALASRCPLGLSRSVGCWIVEVEDWWVVCWSDEVAFALLRRPPKLPLAYCSAILIVDLLISLKFKFV